MKLSESLSNGNFQTLGGEIRMHEGHKVPRFWIVTADRMSARIFSRKDGKLVELGRADVEPSEGHNGKTDSYHVAHTKNGNTGHGHDERGDRIAHEETDLTRGLTALLDKAEKANVFDRLILSAAPRTLGSLRSALSQNVKNRIVVELDKDLTHLPERDILDHLKDVVWS